MYLCTLLVLYYRLTMKTFIQSVNIKLIAALLLLSFCTPSFGQSDSKRVRDVQGKCELTRHITLEQAEQKALQDAKTNALRKAGVPEKLWTVTGLINEDDGSEFSQVLSRVTTLEVDGFINIRDVKYDLVEIDGKRYATATIDADVKRGGKTDPTFVLDVKDVDGVYSEGEALTFNATVYGHDAYIKIFWFDENGGSIVYPNDYETNRLFLKETAYAFPTNNQLEYVMERKHPEKEYETINLIAVATKENIPFLEQSITFESLLKWIYAIPADQRAAYREAILIR